MNSKPRHRKLTFLVTFVTAALGLAAETNKIVVSDYPGGSLFAHESRIVISTKLRLNSDSAISADELVLNAALVTAGNRLQIDVRKLVFGPAGKIVAFEDAAPQNTAVGNTGAQGDPGDSHEEQKDDGNPQDGDPGKPGRDGLQGPPGFPGNQDPAEILVFASKVEGTPRIDGMGQQGGKGARGGAGGKGGHGGKGSKADAHWWGSSTGAGNAGGGGPGGSGGKGGRGGRGGRAVKITFLVGHLGAEDALAQIVSKPGPGGTGGDPGDKGPIGDTGAEGDDDSGALGINHRNAGDGIKAYNGAQPPTNLGAGEQGEAGSDSLAGFLSEKINCDESAPKFRCSKQVNTTIYSFNEFEDRRYNTFKSWYAFHWKRTLNFLVRDSIRLARHLNESRETLNSRLAAATTDMAARALIDLDSAYTAKVVTAWNTQFLAPLELAPRETLLSGEKDHMMQIGRSVIAMFTASPTSSSMHEILNEVNDSLQIALNEAIGTCLSYNELTTNLLSSFFGATKHYTVPVCTDLGKFRDRANLGSVIELAVPYAAQASPEALNSFLLPAPQASILDIIKTWIAPNAFADENQIVFVHDGAYSIPHIIAAEPVTRANVQKDGVLIGYKPPAAEQVTLETLSEELRALAIQLGAE